MKWIKVVWHFVLRHLPRWLRFAAEVVEDSHEDCPVCKDEYPGDYPEDIVPDSRDDNPYMDYAEYCRNCDLFDDCKEDETDGYDEER